MFCPKCGSSILLADSHFCTECGFDLRQILEKEGAAAQNIEHAQGKGAIRHREGEKPLASVARSKTVKPKKSKLKVFFLVAAISVGALVLVAVAVAIVSPSFFDSARETVQGLKMLGGKSDEELSKEKDEQLLAEALANARESKIEEAFMLLGAIKNPALQQRVSQIRLEISKAMIQGSWEQTQGGMGYTRILRFDDGVISVVDGFSNSSYRGTYEIEEVRVARLPSLTVDCTMRYGYQNTTIHLTVQFWKLKSIEVNGNWAPTSNGTYSKLN